MRHLHKTLLAGAIALAIASTALWAQTGTFVLNLTGNEVFEGSFGNQGPGGTGFNTPAYVLRNGTGYVTAAAGTTVNTTVPNTASKALAIGAITTWNVTLPTSPFDGQSVAIACPGGTATAAVTATSPSGVTIVGTAFTACTSGGAAANTAEYIYSTSAKTWYRIQ